MAKEYSAGRAALRDAEEAPEETIIWFADADRGRQSKETIKKNKVKPAGRLNRIERFFLEALSARNIFS